MHSRRDHPFEDASLGAPYSMNVVCVNADEVLYFRHDVGPQLFEGRYTAGFWAWELPSFPEMFHQAFTTVDEVWVGSDFVRDAIAAHTEKPVLTVPLPVGIPQLRPNVAVPFGDDSFRFLFLFDFLSFAERKNPLGLIEAFSRAFGPGEGPTLLIKTINGDRALEELERLRSWRQAAGHPGRRQLPHAGGARGADRNRGLLRLAPPRRGIRVHNGGGDGGRCAHDRHRLQRQSRFHER